MYLPLPAVIVPVVIGLHRLLGWRSGLLFTALAVGLGWTTARRNLDDRSPFALWSATARAFNNLGSQYLKRDNLSEAMRCFHRALQRGFRTTP